MQCLILSLLFPPTRCRRATCAGCSPLRTSPKSSTSAWSASSPIPTRADQRISEIQTELAPLLAEHRRRFPDRDSQAPALWSHRDPFDGDARVIARAAGTDDPDAYPIIAFL